MDLENVLRCTLLGTALAGTGTLLYLTSRMSKIMNNIVEGVIKINAHVSGFYCVAEDQVYQQMQNLLPSDNSHREELEDEYNELIAQHHGLLNSVKGLVQRQYKFRPAKVIA